MAIKMSSVNPEKIEFACPSCKTRMAVASHHAGKLVKCRCQQQVQVPLVAQLATSRNVSNPAPTSGRASEPKKPQSSPIATPAVNPAEITTFVCSGCNSTLNVKKSDVGKSCRCRCGTMSTIPGALPPVALEPLFPTANNKEFDFDFGGSSAASDLGPPLQHPVVGNPYHAQGHKFTANAPTQSSAPLKLPQRSESQKSQKTESWEGQIFNGSVMGGVVAMVIAVVWFFVGLAGGVIFFYPPVLFIIGLVGMIRGLVNG